MPGITHWYWKLSSYLMSWAKLKKAVPEVYGILSFQLHIPFHARRTLLGGFHGSCFQLDLLARGDGVRDNCSGLVSETV